jgi:hypothetical protein
MFDDSPEVHANGGHGKILGGGMVGTHAGDMIGEIALAIEMGADAVDIGKTNHPTPRWARASAWRRRWRTAVAQMCRLPSGNPFQSLGNSIRFALPIWVSSKRASLSAAS